MSSSIEEPQTYQTIRLSQSHLCGFPSTLSPSVPNCGYVDNSACMKTSFHLPLLPLRFLCECSLLVPSPQLCHHGPGVSVAKEGFTSEGVDRS